MGHNYYFSRFKAPTLYTFDSIESPNQHIYYFKSQTGNVVPNDNIMARLFISTLKGVAFEWFMKLPASSIKNWANLEKLFLTRFFEDGTEVTMPTLLVTKQKKGESIKAFVEIFRNMTLDCTRVLHVFISYMSHFCIKTLLFNVFSCLVAYKVIKEEKRERETDRFI